MVSHLKRLAVPKTWPILRKVSTFTTRPKPGAHPLELGLPLSVFMKEVLDIGVRTTKEAKKVVDAGNVFVDGKVCRDYRRIVGLMDVVSIPSLKQQFRIVLDGSGKLAVLSVDEKEAGLKLARIVKKTVVAKGKHQVTLSDGKNLLMDKSEYKVGDTLVVEVPGQKVKQHIPLEEGNFAYLLGGKHIGSQGSIKAIEGEKVLFIDSDKNETETLVSYVMVVGKTKPEVKINE